jgi:hypothetical protein
MNAHIVYSARQSLIVAVLIALLGVTSFFAFEPKVGRAITDDFIVTQQITDEISFLVAAADVSMVSSIAGVTGGSATGTTMIVVRSNDSLGYNMTLHFSSSTAMNLGNGSAYINNYTPTVAGVPDFTWANNSTGQPAEFGYTVMASTTTDVDQSFLNNASACNTGSSSTIYRCWLNPSTTPETIINRTSATGNGGATTTLIFHVAVPNAPSPALPSGNYIATGTLTATNN